MRFKKCNKHDLEMKEIYKLVNKLVKDKKLKFEFYNSIKDLDLLQCYYNKKADTIEFRFRDVIGENIQELKLIMNQIEKN
ncbi:MAG: hypothetical protein IKF97_00535 [Clostridia bacterium]|nr:hypothetical protein [Clostridia bacterium]